VGGVVAGLGQELPEGANTAALDCESRLDPLDEPGQAVCGERVLHDLQAEKVQVPGDRFVQLLEATDGVHGATRSSTSAGFHFN